MHKSVYAFCEKSPLWKVLYTLGLGYNNSWRPTTPPSQNLEVAPPPQDWRLWFSQLYTRSFSISNWGGNTLYRQNELQHNEFNGLCCQRKVIDRSVDYVRKNRNQEEKEDIIDPSSVWTDVQLKWDIPPIVCARCLAWSFIRTTTLLRHSNNSARQAHPANKIIWSCIESIVDSTQCKQRSKKREQTNIENALARQYSYLRP